MRHVLELRQNKSGTFGRMCFMASGNCLSSSSDTGATVFTGVDVHHFLVAGHVKSMPEISAGDT